MKGSKNWLWREVKEVGLIYQTPALKQERVYSQSAGASIRKKPSAVSNIEQTDLSSWSSCLMFYKGKDVYIS